jgi:hypothetical protein
MQTRLEIGVDDLTESQQQGQLVFLHDEERGAADECQHRGQYKGKHAFT